MAFKLVVAKCNRYNKYIALQVEPSGREAGVVIGYYKMGSKDTNSQIYVRRLTTRTPCAGCGTTNCGSCSCGERSCNGLVSKSCLTCRQLSLDMRRTEGVYGQYAGVNDIAGEKDRFGNVLGSQGDLGVDGAFRGKKIVLHSTLDERRFLSENRQITANVTNSLAGKGFSVQYCYNVSAATLRSYLADACQYWLISGSSKTLNDEHLRVVREFYERGRGIYIWGDNDPFNVDANFITQALFNVTMKGDYDGRHVLGISDRAGSSGILRGHLLSTGIVSFYEGSTIANIKTNNVVKPLTYSSDGNVVTAYVEDNDTRCLIDGGFTRLYYDWDSAATERYVKNAAVWLANYERFFEEYE